MANVKRNADVQQQEKSSRSEVCPSSPMKSMLKRQVKQTEEVPESIKKHISLLILYGIQNCQYNSFDFYAFGKTKKNNNEKEGGAADGTTVEKMNTKELVRRILFTFQKQCAYTLPTHVHFAIELPPDNQPFSSLHEVEIEEVTMDFREKLVDQLFQLLGVEPRLSYDNEKWTLYPPFE